MSTERAFWAAIGADPRDKLPRLVYADWLAENCYHLTEEAVRLTIDLYPEPRAWDGWLPTLSTRDLPRVEGWYWVRVNARVANSPVNRHFAVARSVWDALPGKARWLWYKRSATPAEAFGRLWNAWLAVHHPDARIDVLDRVNLFDAETAGR